jgi:3'(2'), 5'-bisphosphate nucleotidase
MIESDFSLVLTLMEKVGYQIVSWRCHKEFRHLYSEEDFKTEADRRAHNLIVEGLELLFPGVAIISEESDIHFQSRPDAYWLIDPIDGTASWYNGFPGFVTQAAFIFEGDPIFGVINAPTFAKTWFAVKGLGAYLNGKRMNKLLPCERLILVDNTPKPHGIAEDIANLLSITDYVESGSLGLKSVLVADGTVDLFVKDVCVRDWDLAPASVILREVGGHLRIANGSPYVFNGSYQKSGGIIIARDEQLLQRVVAAFAKSKNSYKLDN